VWAVRRDGLVWGGEQDATVTGKTFTIIDDFGRMQAKYVGQIRAIDAAKMGPNSLSALSILI